MVGRHAKNAGGNPNGSMNMSPTARARLRATEKAVYRYYNDMGKNKGHCTWGAGILVHKGVCSEEELQRKVSVDMVNLEFERRVAETEHDVRRNTKVPLNQEQFDALCSVTYNRGARGTRATFEFINRGDFSGAAENISRMIKVEIKEGGKKKYVVAPGLIKRREEESAPFRVEHTAVPSGESGKP
ncbi:lysozyme [Massilia sp. HP4]|uniref:lysozyme n=1 Tax=Massilia sp. HP4 TaxID=2562316 RepID=UPI001E5A2362|nr:glycoside hydrolase family protein [Massilia sp. HP4]